MTSSADETSAQRPEPRAPRGFPDRRGADLAGERRLIAALAGVYERYGFEPLDTPAFEYADALGKFLPDADRPNEGVFALRDDDEQWMALRYDLTAPLARFAAENWQALAKPYRRWAYGSVWRNEKPGPGRFRQFTQCDADTVGSDRPEADAEMVALAVEGLAAAGVPAGAAVMKISTRKLLDGLMEAHGITDQVQRLTTLRAIDKFDRLGWAGVRDLLGKGRLDESGDFTRGAGLAQAAINDVEVFLTAASEGLSREDVLKALAEGKASATRDQGLADLERIDQALKAMGVTDVQARFDPAVVRGLEYYTGAVFEAELVAKDAKGQSLRLGSVGGGGRYDDLVARFTGERTPATGFSFGVSRLTVALQAMEWAGAGKPPRGPVVVLALDAEGMADFFAAAAELRAAGIAAEVYLGSSGMKAQMKYADRRLAPAVVILGGDERASGQVTVKDLDLGRALAAGVSDHETWKSERPGQQTAPRARLIEIVQGILNA